MSKIKRKKLNINDGIFKVNNISLLKQSGFNFPLKKIQINNNNLDIFKEILINSKKVEKPFNIFFTPIQKINPNKKIKNNVKPKPYPLSEKNKIIRKHNILKKIDFNVNYFKDRLNNDVNKFNNKLKLTLYNNNNFNLIFSNKINNKIELNIPFVAQTSREKRDSIKINNFSKNLTSSFSFNNLKSSNFSSFKLYRNKNNLNTNFNNIFTNEKIKNTCCEFLGKNKLYIDKEIQTNLDFPKKEDKGKKENNNEKNENLGENENKEINIKNINKSKYINLNIKSTKYKFTDNNDESSSNDLDNMKEIENIISKSSLNIHQERKINNSCILANKANYNNNNYDNYDIFHKNNYINFVKKTDNGSESKNKDEFILLKNLYNVKYIQKHYNQFYEICKTNRNIITKTQSNFNRIKKLKKRNKTNSLNKNINIFNRSNLSKENILIKRNKIKDLDDLMPYKSRILFIRKKKLNDLLDLSYEFNNRKINW